MINKQEALAIHLDCEVDEIQTIDEDNFKYYFEEYLVLTEEEADERTKEYIRESIWAFRASFLVYHMDCTEKMTCEQAKDFASMIQTLQETKCENANDILLAMIGENFDSLVQDAICADGRGHFLAHYDFQEHEEGDFFIYRIN